MKLLAIDTSSLACSVALQAGEQIIERHEEQAREHTRLLMPLSGDVLAEAGMSVEQLDAIVLGNGPGSFIGMRIAASVAQGLAHGGGNHDHGTIRTSSWLVIGWARYAHTAGPCLHDQLAQCSSGSADCRNYVWGY